MEALQFLGMSLIQATPNTDQQSELCRAGHPCIESICICCRRHEKEMIQCVLSAEDRDALFAVSPDGELVV